MKIMHDVPFVMLVDDNDTDNLISKRIIELTGFSDRITIKNSGKKALEYLEAHRDDPSQLPQLIFLDTNMPIVDGFVFLYEFEKMSLTVRNHTKVVILSSSDNQRDIERILDNNYVIKFITKPLSPTVLAEINNDLIRAERL